MFHGMKKSPLLGLLGLGLSWCNLTHWGFLNFMGALGLFAMCVGLTLLVLDAPSRAPAGRRSRLTLVALFFTHIFRYPFALAAVVGAAVVMYPATRRVRPIVAPLVPALGLMALWLVGAARRCSRAASGRLSVHTRAARGDARAAHGRVQRSRRAAARSTGSSARRSRWRPRARRRRARAPRSLGAASRRAAIAWDVGVTVVPLACAAVFLGLFLVLPMQMGVWWYVYPREATAAALHRARRLPGSAAARSGCARRSSAAARRWRRSASRAWW